MKEFYLSNYSTKEAIRNYGIDDYTKWHTTKQINTDKYAFNRLKNNLYEPYLETSFSFSKDDNFFTVGSCFARGLEKSLIQDGLNVLSVTNCFDKNNTIDGTTAMGFMNKYNTFSILNEFDWALNNKFLNGENFIEIDTDLFFDTNTNPTLPISDYKTTIERRRKINSLFNQVKDSRIITITLGLIEAWYDNELKQYLNVTPHGRLFKKYPNRFEFRITSFEENMRNLDEIYDLLSIHCPKDFHIVITVSPVPLQNTFSGRDIVVANTFSKSLLRTIADTWAYKHTNVSYFPSYEIVMNSNQNLVWEDDRRHVKGLVTQYIMEIFKKHYFKNYKKWDERICNIQQKL